MRLKSHSTIRLACTVAFLVATAVFVQTAGSDPLPEILETSPDDFVCISGYVRDASTQEPLVGVGVFVYPGGVAVDSLEPAGVITENGVQYAVPRMPRLRWLCFTNSEGEFAVCDIPSELSSCEFKGVIYKPGYVPQFPEAVQIDAGSEPVYGSSFSVQQSQL